MPRALRRTALVALALLPAACLAPEDGRDCSGDRCESAASRADLLAAIDGFADPIAEMLREQATERGTLAGDYRTVLDDLGELTGCDPSTQKSFVVLTNNELIPKLVFARCTDSPQLASRFFVAAPTIDADRDMLPGSLHMSAWDEEAQRYRHYATIPDDETGEMRINVAPSFCMGCHGGPEHLPTWQPLMNEMTNPWSQWHAGPGFSSSLFDGYIDPETTAGATYQQMTAPDLLDSASNLEPLVRAGIARFVDARIRGRLEAPSPERALELLRPVFCDETVNYVSEIHDSGEVRSSAFIDGGLRALLAQIDPESPWPWVHDTSTRLPAPSADDPAVELIAVRGESAIQAELALASRRVLDPAQLLRARALDWTHPVASELRCDVYRAGAERIAAGALDGAVAALADGATTADLIPAAFDEILRDYPAPAGEVAALADAARPGEIQILTPAELAETIAGYLDSRGRAELRAARDRRGCWAKERYLNASLIPDLECP